MKKLLYKNKQGNATMKNTFKVSKPFNKEKEKRLKYKREKYGIVSKEEKVRKRQYTRE